MIGAERAGNTLVAGGPRGARCGARAPRSISSASAARAQRDDPELLLRPSAPDRDRARARRQSDPAAARRAGGRPQFHREEGAARTARAHRRAGPDHPDHRSRHDAGRRRRAASDRAQFRPAHRRRRDRRGAAPSRRRRRLSRSRDGAARNQRPRASATARSRRCAASRSRSRKARSSRCSAPTAPANRPRCARSPALSRRAPGAILFDGKPIAGLGPRAIVRLGVAHVPEGRRVFPGLTVRENIMLGASNGSASSAAIRARPTRCSTLFPDIRRFADALGWTLSGGQQQMVARGARADGEAAAAAARRALAGPRAGHRAGGVPHHRRNPSRGTTVLLVEQNARMALSVADCGYVLETGRIVLGGKPDDTVERRAHPRRLSRRRSASRAST